MLSAADIRAEFDRVRGGLDSRSVADPESLAQPPEEFRLDGAVARSELDEIARILESHPRFSQRFDFWWATDSRSYNHHYEVTLQLILIAGLVATSVDLSRLRPTAVRCVMSRQLSSTALRGSAVDFICISHGFMKFMQIVVGSIIDLHDLARELTGPTPLCSTNLIFGQDMERALRERPEEADGVCMLLDRMGLALSRGYDVSHHTPLSLRLNNDIRRLSPLLMTAYNACEGFIVCHEVAHLLLGHAYSADRVFRQELIADLVGAKLMTVASSLLANRIPAGVAYGPTLFFNVGGLFDLTRARDAPPLGVGDWNAKTSPRTLGIPMSELDTRKQLLHAFLDRYIPKPQPAPALYRTVAREFTILQLGCMKHQVNNYGEHSLDLDGTIEYIHALMDNFKKEHLADSEP